MKIVKKIFLMLFVFFVGILTVNAESKNIKVTDVTVKEKSTTIEVADPVISDNEITSNITFNQLNDYVTFELTLKNNESDKYKITSITDNNTSNNIEVEYDYPEDFISSNDEAKIRVKLTYKSQLTNSNISLDNLTITFNVENESGETNQIVLNPNTGDNVLHYLVLLIIAITGLILITRKKKKKIGALVLAIGLIIIPFAVLAQEKFELNFKFTNIEVKGEFEEYNVTVDKSDGSEPTTLSITYGETIGELPVAPAKEGHTFVGWIDEQNREVTEETIITGPLNITPVYKKDKHQLTITHPEYLNEGNISGQYEYGTQITLTAKARDGFTFSKWSDNSTDNPRTITIGTSDITIEPIYSRNKYVITFKPNGGTVNIESKEIDTGETIGSLPTPKWKEHRFLGWYTAQDGGVEVTEETIPDGNKIYYAHWEYAPIVVYDDTDNSESFSIGDVVTIGGDEFWVISVDYSRLKLLAKYNLDDEYRQVSSDDSSYFTSSFASNAYWMNLGSASSSASGDYPVSQIINSNGCMSDGDYYYVYKSNSFNNISLYLDNYKSHLIDDIGFSYVNEIKTLSYSDITYLCSYYDLDCSESFEGKLDFIFNQNYWLGTINYLNDDYNNDYSNSYEDLFIVRDNHSIDVGHYSDNNNAGIRPVLTVYANTINKYWDISFDVGDAPAMDPIKVKGGEKLTSLPTPVWEGHEFYGWYSDPELKTKAKIGQNVSEPVMSNRKYYAKWNEIQTKGEFKYIDYNNDSQISPGDGLDYENERFYILSGPSNGTVKLITRYYLNSSYRQAKENFVTVSFADNSYWYDENNSAVYNDYSSSASGYSYIYRDKNGNDTNNNSKIYINNYKNYLDELGMQVIDARLASIDDFIYSGCYKRHVTGNDYICPFSLNHDDYSYHWYWLGSANNKAINYCYYGYEIGLKYYNKSDKNAIRPLIEIPESSITN